MTCLRSLKNILFVLAAFAWLLGTAHCKLEALPGFEVLSCQSENGCHDEKDAAHDDVGCCLMEKTQYKSASMRIVPPSPDLLPVSVASFLLLANSLPAETVSNIRPAVPPELSPSWQFQFRTALPVRAPSSAS